MAPLNMAGDTYRNVAANLSSLAASTTYHFRVVASNTAGTRFGSDKTFTTFTATGPPVVTTNSASNVSPSSVTLNGLLDPHGLRTTVNFQYGTTAPLYGQSTPTQSQTGNTHRPNTANISGLTPHTTSLSVLLVLTAPVARGVATGLLLRLNRPIIPVQPAPLASNRWTKVTPKSFASGLPHLEIRLRTRCCLAAQH